MINAGDCILGFWVLVLVWGLVAGIRFLFYFPGIVFVLCLCLVFGRRTRILGRVCAGPFHFCSLFFSFISMPPPHPQHTQAEADLQPNASSCWCVLRAPFHFQGTVQGVWRLLVFSALAAALGGLLNSGAGGPAAASRARAHTRTPERSELPGGPQVTQPGREAGTACAYSELEGRERTAAACVPGPLYGDTKQIGSPHTVHPPWRQRASKAPVGPTLFPQLCRTQVWGRSKQRELPLSSQFL